MSNPLKCVDLFSGAGGFSLGFMQAGMKILGATDYHETAGETFTRNLDASFHVADIAALSDDVSPLLSSGGFTRDEIDIVIGGPPCKGFSSAGASNPDDARSNLIHHYVRVVDELQPSALVMENVPGAKRIDNGRYVQTVLDRLRSLGYKTRMLELDAANYGVPQRRKRLIFIGYRDDRPISPPPRTHVGDSGQRRLGETVIQDSHVSVEEAISDLAFLGPGEDSPEYQKDHESDYQRLMRAEHDGPLFNHVAPNHGPRVRERYNALDEGEDISALPPRLQTKKHSMVKYDRKQPANTVTTLPEDFIHYQQPRIPTVRELARLQSFPDWFKFEGPRTTGGERRMNSLPQYSQVGNAVPPLFAEAIARHVRATLQGEDPDEAAYARVERMQEIASTGS